MAKKNEELIMAPEVAPVSSGPIPGTARLMNKTSIKRDITLTNGTNVALAAFKRGGTGHISDPIPKILLDTAVRKMMARGEIALIEEVVA